MLLCSCEPADGNGTGTFFVFFVAFAFSFGGFGSAGGFGGFGGFFGVAAAFDRGFALDLLAGTTAGDTIGGGFVISLSEALKTLWFSFIDDAVRSKKLNEFSLS